MKTRDKLPWFNILSLSCLKKKITYSGPLQSISRAMFTVLSNKASRNRHNALTTSSSLTPLFLASWNTGNLGLELSIWFKLKMASTKKLYLFLNTWNYKNVKPAEASYLQPLRCRNLLRWRRIPLIRQ